VVIVNNILGFSTTYWKKFIFFLSDDPVVMSRRISSNGSVTGELKKISEESIL